MKVYNELINGVIDLLDSVAMYPAMWLLTIVAAVVACRMIYNIGFAMGQVSGL